MTTTTIVFDRKRKATNGGEGKIEIRLTDNRKSYYFSTGIKVRREQWEFDTVVYHPAADELNKRISILVRKIIKEANDMLEAGHEIDVEAIRKKVSDVDHEKALLQWIAQEIPNLNIRKGTRKHYNSTLHRLTEWGKMQSWKDVTVENIYKWDVYLHRRKGNLGKISQSGVHNYHRNFRALLTRAVRQGKLSANPYFLLKGEFPKGDKENTEYLTDEEMQKIEELKPVPGTWFDAARDLFIFQAYTGLSYSDAQAFDIKKYKKINGQWRIIGTRIKTGEPYVNQLLPPAVKVLEKYGMKTPQIINAVYNRELKTIGMAAGITTPLHSHLARHTFATWMLRNGAKLENVSKMLGHTNIKTTLRYAKVLAESVHDDFMRMAQKLNEQEEQRAQEAKKSRKTKR